MKEKFKSFVKNKPYLNTYIKNGSMTWQKFYELYVLYGEDDKVWSSYIEEKDDKKIDASRISEFVKSVDIDSIKEHVSNAQKALDLVQELTLKTKLPEKTIKPLKEINKFFED